MKKLGIVILIIIIIIGIGLGFFVLNKSAQKVKSNKNNSKAQQTEQQTETTLSNITNTQILNLANASMSNVDYTFKSVFEKQVVNGQLQTVLLGLREVNGQYESKRINVTFQDVNGDISIVPGSMQGTNVTTSENVNYNGPVNISSKEQAIDRVLQYYNSSGYNVNATDWGMDVFPNQTIGNYTGYLVHTYETFNGNPKSVGWILVTDGGTLYNAGPTGNGPMTTI